MKVIVIIPAAGLGTRMGQTNSGARTKTAKAGSVSKQFAELGGAPILIHTLRKFSAVPDVTEIYIAMRLAEAEGFRDRMNREGLKKPIQIVEGGRLRQQSVENALEEIKASASDIVLVHDAVRPFVDAEVIQNVIRCAQKTGAAIAAIPAIDTIKQVNRTAEGAVVTATIPREHIVLVQTPQGFRYDVLKKAFEEAKRDGFTGTDEASLVERSGHEVSVVMGSLRNMKITTPTDMELAEFYLGQDSRPLAG